MVSILFYVYLSLSGVLLSSVYASDIEVEYLERADASNSSRRVMQASSKRRRIENGLDTLSVVPSELFGNIGMHLSWKDINSLRKSAKPLNTNISLIEWSYARLYRQPIPQRFTYSLYQAITSISRSLSRPTLLPEEHELEFIAAELSKDHRLTVAVALIPAIKGDEEATFRELKRLAKRGNQLAQKEVNLALYKGVLGQHVYSEGKRLMKLKKIAAAGNAEGNQDAQKYVNKAIYEGDFNQFERPLAERFEELKSIATAGNDEGNQDAQKYILKAIYEGDFNQDTRLETERFEELKAIATAGNSEVHQHALKLVAEALYGGILGQDTRSEAERFEELKAIAATGNSEGHQYAQKFIVESLYNGTLGQNIRPTTERFMALRDVAAAGSSEWNQHAQKLINQALYLGTLGQDTRPITERFVALRVVAITGSSEESQHAQRYINQALYQGKFGLDARPEPDRLRELRLLAAVTSSMTDHNNDAHILTIDALINRQGDYAIHHDINSVRRKTEFMYQFLGMSLRSL